jgi:KUP system potassium uptake protein
VSALLLVVDVSFLAANLPKISEGGWFPLLVAATVFTLMFTWRRGSTRLARRLRDGTEPLESFFERIAEHPPLRVSGTAVFLTHHSEGTPAILRHQVKHNQVLHERILLLTVIIEEVPRVPLTRRMEVAPLALGFARVILRFGFMENPDVPRALRAGGHFGLEIDPDDVTYYVGHPTLLSGDLRSGLAAWSSKLFAFLLRNAADPTAFYGLPAARVFEIGIRGELQP